MANQATDSRTVMVQGRLVWMIGDPFKGGLALDYNTKKPKLGKDGQQFQEYGFGLAVPKSILQQVGPGQPGEIWAAIHEQAYLMWPDRKIPNGFSWKYKDGDEAEFASKEGYPGHMVFSCKTLMPIKYFKWENGANTLINEGIKCGDYVNVQLSVKAQNSAKPGLYLNPNAIQFLGYGKEIVNAPSGDQIFGAGAPPMPSGASALPIAPQGQAQLIPTAGAPPMPGGFQAPAHYGVLPAQFQPPPQQPAAVPNGYYQPGGAPPAAPAYGQPPQAPGAYALPVTAPAQPMYPNQQMGYMPPGAPPVYPQAAPMAPTSPQMGQYGGNSNGQMQPAYPQQPGIPVMPGYPPR